MLTRWFICIYVMFIILQASLYVSLKIIERLLNKQGGKNESKRYSIW